MRIRVNLVEAVQEHNHIIHWCSDEDPYYSIFTRRCYDRHAQHAWVVAPNGYIKRQVWEPPYAVADPLEDLPF